MFLTGSGEVSLHIGVPGRTFPCGVVSFENDVILQTGYVEYGSFGIDVDIVYQTVDVSTGTPVVAQKVRYGMNQHEGEYPSNFRMLSDKLDSSRAISYWQGKDRREWLQVVRVTNQGKSIEVGPAVEIVPQGGNVFPANPKPGGPQPPAYNCDTLREDTLRALPDGKACVTAVFRYYHVASATATPGTGPGGVQLAPVDGTTWIDVFAVMRVTTNGLNVIVSDWWLLNEGTVRFTYPRLDQVNGSVAIGERVLMTTLDRQTSGAAYRTYTAVISWSATGVPLMARAILIDSSGCYLHIMSNGSLGVVLDGESYYPIVLSPGAPVLGIQPMSPNIYTAVGTSFNIDTQPNPTHRGTFLVIGTVPWRVYELRVTPTGTFELINSSDLDVSVPPGAVQHYAALAAVTDRKVCVIVDFKLPKPFNYLEMMYVYELTGKMTGSDFRENPHFLQVRTG